MLLLEALPDSQVMIKARAIFPEGNAHAVTLSTLYTRLCIQQLLFTIQGLYAINARCVEKNCILLTCCAVHQT